MDFPLSRDAAPHFIYVPQTGSTNRDLADLASELPDFAVLTTDFQSEGRGRLDRMWSAPAKSSVMASILLKPANKEVSELGWLSLILAESIRAVLAQQLGSVGVKWPNDVLVGDKKVSGILAQVLPQQQSVVVGFGLNVSQKVSDLPTPEATSLLLAGFQDLDRDGLLSKILREFRLNYESYLSASDFSGSSLLERIRAGSATIGKRVRVLFPDGASRTGLAKSIDDQGRLVVQAQEGDFAVSAGDILHLRVA